MGVQRVESGAAILLVAHATQYVYDYIVHKLRNVFQSISVVQLYGPFSNDWYSCI